MDLGFVDLDCISAPASENQCTESEHVLHSEEESVTANPQIANAKNRFIKEASQSALSALNESVTANSQIASAKNRMTKEAIQSASSALNKFTSQIKKPPHRKTSPINWFPRKKVDSYLKRKIKMLQEVDGMNLTLDQTLGNSNPHYSRVLREKMAAREAAHKVMEARRAALVEASWCRILRAARIHCEHAETRLIKAEKSAVEAFEAAQAMGVIMYDMPNNPRKHCQIETSSANGEESSTHTVTASFETAFEVDKEVAAAVKNAFVRLANCSSFNKDEFRELLRKISQNPDTDENNQDSSEFSSEYESESGPELNSVSQMGNFNSHDLGINLRKSRRRQSLEKINRIKLEDMMIERLKGLREDELSSLATIVATCGLNAALAEVQDIKQHNLVADTDHTSTLRVNFSERRISSVVSGKSELIMDGPMRKKQVESELPTLDKFLVKHMTKLEREVQEAKNKKNQTEPDKDSYHKPIDATPAEMIPDLGSILVKNYSKFEKDIREARNKSEQETLGISSIPNHRKDQTEVPSLEKFLVKHVSRLEKEVQDAKSKRINENNNDLKKEVNLTISGGSSSCSDEAQEGKENMPSDKVIGKSSEIEQNQCKLNTGISLSNCVNNETEENKDSLDKILKKPVHRLEREKIQAMLLGSQGENYRQRKNQGVNNITDCESLDKILVKHVSRLEKQKTKTKSEEQKVEIKKNHKNIRLEAYEGGLDQILVKHRSRLEREKLTAAQQPENPTSVSMSRREARERELQEAWGGLSLGNSMKPRLSKLERDKQPENPVSVSLSRREARERELQEAWGGLSLGNSMKPHLSKLERDKAAWIKAEEEQKRQGMKAT